jgi:hypothetical protein
LKKKLESELAEKREAGGGKIIKSSELSHALSLALDYLHKNLPFLRSIDWLSAQIKIPMSKFAR